MAAAYLDEIRGVQPRGPYHLGGSSSGGVVAYEMAQQLHAQGERVAALVLLDTRRAGPPPARIVETLGLSPLHGRARLLDYHFGHLLLRRPRAGLAYLAGRARARWRGEADSVAGLMKHTTPVVRRVYEHNVRALSAYVPRPYPGGATMLLSHQEPDRTFYDGRLAWAELVQGGLLVRFIPGDHTTMLDEPHVAGVAEALASSLA
jgi:aspartate racemase